MKPKLVVSVNIILSFNAALSVVLYLYSTLHLAFGDFMTNMISFFTVFWDSEYIVQYYVYWLVPAIIVIDLSPLPFSVGRLALL